MTSTPTAERLLNHLHRGGVWAHYWTPNTGEYWTDDNGNQHESRESLWFQTDKVRPIPFAWVANRNVYFCVHPQVQIPEEYYSDTGKRKPDNRVKARNELAASVNCFFVEFDAKDFAGGKDEILGHIATLPIKPSVVVDSGGGYHLYFLLADTIKIDDSNRDLITAIQHAFVDLVGGDNNVKDLARVLRVPGTKNLKYTGQPVVTVIHEDYAQLYDLAVFDDLTKNLRAAKQTTTTPPTVQTSSGAVDVNARVMKMRVDNPKWDRLWNGDMNDYGDNHSSADLALCSQLGFWLNLDPVLIDQAFRCSALMRPKWLRDDYRNATIAKALQGKTACYQEDYRSGSVNNLPGNPSVLVGNKVSFGTNGNHTTTGATPAAGPAQQSGAQTTTPPTAAGNFLLTLPTDDEGVAECVDLRYNGRFLHTESHGWLQYAGTHWKAEGADAAVERAITETLDARIKAALAAGAQNHADLIKRSARNSRGVKAAKAQLQSRAHADIASFDNDPNLLNCPNGVVDLRTGHLQPHSANQRFMYCAAVNYNPNADYVDWSSWLESSTSTDTADWLQMAVGYSLTGYTREEVFFYLYGPPRSGKGTFVDAIMKMLGDPVAQATKFSTFTADRGKDDQNFDLAPLKSARFIAASESNANERFNEAKVKNITGGDKIQCAFKHKDSFGYIPMYKVWLSSNSPINADPDDDAVWGRTRLVHFPNSHLGKEDKTLKQRMHSTKGLEAILAWAVAGAVRWYALGSAGLPELGALSKLKQEQRAELDHVQQWVDECCNTTDPLAFSTNENVHTSYRTWCTDNGVTPKAKKGLTQSLNKKGFVSNSSWIVNPNTGTGKTARGFMGVKINP